MKFHSQEFDGVIGGIMQDGKMHAVEVFEFIAKQQWEETRKSEIRSLYVGFVEILANVRASDTFRMRRTDWYRAQLAVYDIFV